MPGLETTSVARWSTMKARRSGVFLPMKNSSARPISPMPPTITGASRIDLPMNWPNSSGLISPRPLKRVTSLPRSAAIAAVALRLGVAVARLLLVADAEQRRLEDVDVALDDELLEVAQEVGEQQVADVHAVDVGVGGDHDLRVAQAVDAVLDAERAHQVVELFVLVDRVALEAVAVERLAAQAEDGLGLDVARLDHHAAGRVALGQEDRRSPRGASPSGRRGAGGSR